VEIVDLPVELGWRAWTEVVAPDPVPEKEAHEADEQPGHVYE
jgi:hypothetical protein